MKPYGILVIGCGKMGIEHLLGIYDKENVSIVAVVDTDIERAKKAARLSGALSFGTDYKQYLKMDEVDIVIIATYASSHLEILKDCLAYGKHVLCEKPIASTYEDGISFLGATKEAKSKVLIAHILRYNASYLLIKKLIKDGKIGDVRMIRMTQNHHALDWQRYKRLMEDCSPTVDCGVHYYDIVEWITGDRITEVTGFGTRTEDDSPCDNYTLVTYKTEGGIQGYYEAGWGKSIRSLNTKEFIGTKGRISLEMRDRRTDDREEGDLITVFHSDTGKYDTYNVNAPYKDMYTQLSALIDMIEGTPTDAPTMDEAWRAFIISLTADKSIKSGKSEPVLN